MMEMVVPIQTASKQAWTQQAHGINTVGSRAQVTPAMAGLPKCSMLVHTLNCVEHSFLEFCSVEFYCASIAQLCASYRYRVTGIFQMIVALMFQCYTWRPAHRALTIIPCWTRYCGIVVVVSI